MSKNKNIITTLKNRYFRSNKNRNLVAILAIVLTTLMFTALFTMAQSMEQNITEMYMKQSGHTFHASANGLSESDIEVLTSHDSVESYGKSIILAISENPELSGRTVEIRYADETFAKNSFSYPTTGRMPLSENEIAIETQALKAMGITPQIGAEITLSFKKDIYSEEITTQTFEVVGYFEGNESIYSGMAYVSEDYALDILNGLESASSGQYFGMRTLDIYFNNDNDLESKIQALLSDTGLTNLELKPNATYMPETTLLILRECFSIYTGMALVFVAGILIIYNIFQISISSDIAFYGKLKTLGTTNKQIKKIVLSLSNRLSMIAIPIGVVLGFILGTLLVPILLDGNVAQADISVNPIIFVGSILVSYFTVLISSLVPARMASKVSPMEALRYTESGTKRKIKKSKRCASLLSMAWSNVWRNKKRVVLVLFSLTLGLVLMSYFYANNAGINMELYVRDLSVADYQIDDPTQNENSGIISENLLSDINALTGLEEIGYLYSAEISEKLSENASNNYNTFFTQEVLDDYASYDPTFPEWKKGFDKAVNNEEVPFTIYGADDITLSAATGEYYLLDGEYDAEKFSNGNYAIAITGEIANSEILPSYSVGENITVGGEQFEIMAVVSPFQPIVEGTSKHAFDVPFIIHTNHFIEIWADKAPIKVYFNVADESMQTSLGLLTTYRETTSIGMNITDRTAVIEQYKSQVNAGAVTGYAISAIVALVGILNFINSMITAIISRKKEFAMIQSIGMTNAQLKQMLMFEGLLYAGLTLVLSYILSVFTVGVLVEMMNTSGYFVHQFTLFPLFICTPILCIVAILIPYICFKNLEKQSIVERLRIEA